MYNAHGDAGPPAGQNAADGGGGQESADEEAGGGGGGNAVAAGEAVEGTGVARTQDDVRELVTGEAMHDDNDD